MARAEVLWPFVEKTLWEILGDRMKVVDKHVIAVKHGSSNVLIRLLDVEEPRLQVFSMMLQNIQESPELLDALNDLSAGLAFAKVFWADGDVIIATELFAESLDRESLNNAVNVVAGAADRLDDELKSRFGGETAFPQPPEEDSKSEGEEGPKAEDEGAPGAPEGIGLPPGMEQGEEREATGPASEEAPPPEEPAAAKRKHDPDETAGYL